MTATDTPDSPEIALPAFEDALWAALRAEHARARATGSPISSTSTTDDVEVLDPTPVVVPVDAPGRQRRALRRVLAAAAAVAVLAGIGVVAATRGDDGGTTVAGPSTESPTTEPLTIEEQAAAAMAPIEYSSVSVEDSYEDGVLVSRRWTDTLSFASRTVWYDADGDPTGETGVAVPPTGEEPPREGVWVDHCRRQWGRWDIGFHETSEFMVVAKDTPHATFADGREELDGRELIRLRPLTDEAAGEVLDDEGNLAVARDEIRPDQLEQRINYLLDPETLLPVAARFAPTDGFRGSLVRIAIEPRDAETLQELVTTGPAGYEEVPPPADGGSFSNPFQGASEC